MGVINQPEDLLSRIRDLELQVRELRRRSVSNAVISQGGLEVRTPDGDVIVRAGEMDVGGQPAFGMQIFRRNGTMQARFFDTPGGGGYFAFFDEAENVILSNDTVSGVGLALPYVPLTAMRYSEVLTPPLSTTSATFEILWRYHGQKQLPRVRSLLLVDSDSDTTGEIILSQGGVQVGPTITVEANANSYMWHDATVSGGHLSSLYLDLQARRTAGTGSVKVAPAWISGVQS